MRRSAAFLALLLAFLGVVLPAVPADAATTRDLLNALTVSSELSRTGYDRSLFPHWIDGDGDGCDTREEVLIQESRVTASTGAGCSVTSGSWYSYYDGVYVSDPGSLDIDHMVPLAEAWDSGAKTWTTDRRRSFANDLGSARSLVAVTASSNRAKGDQDPAEWKPRTSVYCRYATDWINVKHRWSLTVNSTEKSALSSMLNSC